MSHLYLYRPVDGIPMEVARVRMDAALASDCERVHQISGVKIGYRVASIGRVLIGQVTFNTGLTGWKEWYEGENGGIAWAGVCEDFLGVGVDENFRMRMFCRIRTGGESMGILSGKFAVVAWDSKAETIMLATATGEVPSLWSASGPKGWAAGFRSTILTSLVGRDVVVNTEAAREFMAFGYLLRPHSLIEGIARIRGRSRITIAGQEVPRLDTYWSVADAVDCRPPTGLTTRDSEDSTERLRQRLARQLKFSAYPQCMITGGQDSRCIAAGLVVSGYVGSAQTSGASGNPDVLLGRRVARVLGLKHEHLRSSSVSDLAISMERLREWSWLTSGRDILRHAVNYHGFFRSEAQGDTQPRQVFHGSNVIGGAAFTSTAGFDHLDSDVTRLREHLNRQAVRQLLNAEWFEGLVSGIASETVQDLDVKTTDFSQYLQIFYWQRRSLQFFGDLLSAKDIWNHHWTPLEGLLVVRAGLRLTPNERFKRDLTMKMTHLLNAELVRVRYLMELEKGRGIQRMLWQGYKLMMGYHPRFPYLGACRASMIPADKLLGDFWKKVLLAKKEQHWMEFVNPKLISSLVQNQPLSELLWRIATLELLIQALDSNHQAPHDPSM